jgi:hypothetical protein
MKATPLFLLGLLAFSGTDAQATTVRCDGCSDITFRQMAAQLGEGEHIIYDLAGARVQGFTVVEYEADRVSLPQRRDVGPEVEDIVLKMSAFYSATGGTMTVGVEVNSDELGLVGLGGATAYDVLGDYNMRARIGDRLAQNGIPIYGAFGQIVNDFVQVMGSMATGFFGFTDDSTIYVTIVFVDGSRLTYKVTPGVPTAELVDNTARDLNGNILLEANGAEFAGTYYFPNDAGLGDFLDRARMLGIEITGPSDTIRCSWDGRTLTCSG